jgi:hypothetical protein
MRQEEIIEYYSNTKIQNEMLRIAKDREIAGTYRDGSYSKRPDILLYPKDILERAKKGIVTFHCSVEKWSQPMQLSSDLKQSEIQNLRKGFDFIIDIDSKSKLEHSIIAAEIVYNFLKDMGVKPTIKFSGNRGFHLSIAEEAFPKVVDFKEIKKNYPEVPQALASFIREKIKENLLEELIKFEGGVASLVKTVPSISELSPYEFVDIEKNWGNRHLFRMPYSLHSKTWLVSLPINFDQLRRFKANLAKPENIKINDFLVNRVGEATEFLLQALDWSAKYMPKEEAKTTEKLPRFKKPIPEEYFPVCIKQLLKGIFDGKKRSLFTLITFLRGVNWDKEKVEQKIREWNALNNIPLREQFIKTQLKWHFRQNRELLPPNSDSDLFYKSIGIIHDKNCGKNPVNDAIRLYLKRK